MCIPLKQGSQNCLFSIDINKISIIVKSRFYSFILRSVIILTQGYHIFLLIRKIIIILVNTFSRLIFVQSTNSHASLTLCSPTIPTASLLANYNNYIKHSPLNLLLLKQRSIASVYWLNYTINRKKQSSGEVDHLLFSRLFYFLYFFSVVGRSWARGGLAVSHPTAKFQIF